MPPRTYNSPARDLARQETHQKIFNATAKVILEQGVHAFTIRNVATAAGVAHRTVYRHFPSREALLEGLADTFEEPGGGTGAVPPVDQWVQAHAKACDQFAANSERARAIHAAVVALGHPLRARSARTIAMRSRVAEAFPALSREECEEAAAAVRTVASSACWVALTTEHGLAPEGAKRATGWAISTLLADLAARNAAASV